MKWTIIKSEADYPPKNQTVLVKYKESGNFEVLQFNHDDEYNDYMAYTFESMVSINSIEKWTPIIE